MVRSLRRSALSTALALGALVGPIAAPVQAAGIIRITEVMSNSTTTNSAGSIWNGDWFELTNYGDASVDISGWKMDDNSFSFANSVALKGVTSVGIGESVVFTENAIGDKVSDFETFWGLGSTMQVSYYGGSGVLGTTATGIVSISRSASAYTTSAGGANANVGSPGSAVTLASIPNLYWTANGSSLGGSGTWNASGANSLNAPTIDVTNGGDTATV